MYSACVCFKEYVKDCFLCFKQIVIATCRCNFMPLTATDYCVSGLSICQSRFLVNAIFQEPCDLWTSNLVLQWNLLQWSPWYHWNYLELLYQESCYIRVKKEKNTKSWDQQNCYIRNLIISDVFITSFHCSMHHCSDTNWVDLEGK